MLFAKNVKYHSSIPVVQQTSTYWETSDKDASIASPKTQEDKNTEIQDFFMPQSARVKVIIASIAQFIVKDLRPYCVVENKGFRDMIKTLEPWYNIQT